MIAKDNLTIYKVSKKIARILLISLLANLVTVYLYFPPQKARAVDANDHMMLFWDGNCASPPSGWSVVSDGAGEAFYDAANGGLFPRGNSSYARNAGGALTHTHGLTISTDIPTGSSYKDTTGSTTNNKSHTHSGSGIINAVSSLPAYRTLCIIYYDNGIPTGDSAIPNGAVAIFDAAVPSGWSDVSSNFSAPNQFIRGDSAYNNTGGSNTHQGTGHSITGITLNADNVNVDAPTGNGRNASLISHYSSHSVANQTTDTPDTQPPYIEIYLGKKSSAGSIPNGMIAMFDDTDSSVSFSLAGWTRVSDSGGDFYQRFLKVTGSYGNPSGATTHHHADIVAPTSSAGGSQTTGNGNGGIDAHTHNVTIAIADGTNTNIPPYTDVVIAKKQTDITLLQTDQAAYPGIGDTITVDATFNNYHSATDLNSKKVDYVIFEDGDGNGAPDAGETYITNNCAGSGVWASGNYTHQSTVSVAASNSSNDQWQCSNSNFPDNTTYTLWARWWDGTSYAYNIYDDKGSVTFTSIPTLGQLLFMVLVGAVVFIGYKKGVIRLSAKKRTKKGRSKNKGVFRF
jgi:hypothetical protein